jgi:hypothetical protein
MFLALISADRTQLCKSNNDTACFVTSASALNVARCERIQTFSSRCYEAGAFYRDSVDVIEYGGCATALAGVRYTNWGFKTAGVEPG